MRKNKYFMETRCWVHRTHEGGYLITTNRDNMQEDWKIMNMCQLWKLIYDIQKEVVQCES